MRVWYNGYYSSFPNWLREFDSRHPHQTILYKGILWVYRLYLQKITEGASLIIIYDGGILERTIIRNKDKIEQLAHKSICCNRRGKG